MTRREDDVLSMVWDSAPLDDRLEILGAPELELEIACDAPHANLIARLCAVHPDGASLRVSYGVLNLAHRDGHAEPSPLEPGHRYAIRLKLNDVAFAFPRGHRIRLALSTTYWPIVWPAPYAATVTVSEGLAALVLPGRVPRAEDASVRLPPPEAAPPARKAVLREGNSIREAGRDIGTGERFWRATETPNRVRIEAIGTEIEGESRTEYRIRDDDPLSARMEMVRLQSVQRGELETRTRLHATMHATETDFVVETTLEAFEGEALVCRRDWREAVRRDLI